MIRLGKSPRSDRNYLSHITMRWKKKVVTAGKGRGTIRLSREHTIYAGSSYVHEKGEFRHGGSGIPQNMETLRSNADPIAADILNSVVNHHV